MNQPINGKFGEYGGQYVPEVLMPALHELEADVYRHRIMRRLLGRETLFHALARVAAGAPSYRLWRRLSLRSLDSQVDSIVEHHGGGSR